MQRLSKLLLGTLASAAMTAGVANAGSGDEAVAVLHDADGNEAGEVVLTDTPNGTLLEATLTGIGSGQHAFHIHESGVCEPPFKSAGGHFNPTGAAHGFLDGAGPHAGDMPNLSVPESGELRVEVMNTMVRLDDTLFDADGAAIVMHQGGDDYTTDPAGDAGNRIACGVIERK